VQVDGQRNVRPDGNSLEVITDSFGSVSDVRTRLGNAEAYLRNRSDHRSVFLTVYTDMTVTVETGIESGAFDDPDWARKYLIAFMDRYRNALVDFERGNLTEVSPAWRIGFRGSTNDDTLLVQDALFGIDAHINYDPAFARRDVSIDPNRPSKRRDHDRTNGTLRRLVDVIQRAFADVYDAEGYTRIDDMLGSFNEGFTFIGLREARSLA
jgi:hypothetical protein